MQRTSTLRISQMSYLPISKNKPRNSFQPLFSELKCGWVGELSLSFLLSSHFTTPTLQLMLQQKALVIVPSLMSKSSPFNWRAVPFDMEVLVLIPQATPGHAQGQELTQSKTNFIYKKQQKQYLALRNATFQDTVRQHDQKAPLPCQPADASNMLLCHRRLLCKSLWQSWNLLR